MHTLSRPEVIRCYFDDTFEPHLPAMALRWDADLPGVMDGVWHLPDHVQIKGPAPVEFGVTIDRRKANSYRVRVRWNHLRLSWDSLSRAHIMSSALSPILRALGTDLWYLLDQPIRSKKSA